MRAFQSTIACSCLALLAVACDPENRKAPEVTDADISGKIQGYNVALVCIPQSVRAGEPGLAATLHYSADGGAEYVLQIEKKSVRADKRSVAVSNQGVWLGSVNVQADGPKLKFFAGKDYDKRDADPVAVYNNQTQVIALLNGDEIVCDNLKEKKPAAESRKGR